MCFLPYVAVRSLFLHVNPMRDERETIEALSRDIAELKTMVRMLLNEKQSPGSSDMIGVPEAASICGLTVQTLYKYLSQGKLNIIITKVGKTVKMKREEIIAWNVARMRPELR